MWPGPGAGTATVSKRRTSPGSPYSWKRTVRIVSIVASWSVINISSGNSDGGAFIDGSAAEAGALKGWG